MIEFVDGPSDSASHRDCGVRAATVPIFPKAIFGKSLSIRSTSRPLSISDYDLRRITNYQLTHNSTKGLAIDIISQPLCWHRIVERLPLNPPIRSFSFPYFGQSLATQPPNRPAPLFL